MKYILIIIAIIYIYIIYKLIKDKPTCKSDKSKIQNEIKKYVDIDDYDVREIPNFISDEECDKIIKLTNGKLFPSRIYTDDKDVYSNDKRKSQQCWLDDNSDNLVKNISNKAKDCTNTPFKYQEEMQVVNYGEGGFFSTHYDACDGDVEYCKRMNGYNGPRLYTVLVYLNDNFEGGETIFPLINKSVKPEKGKAVVFKNVDDNGIIIRQALHGGEPVISGEKWILNKWIHLK
jgi:prolyl 4-hydroxylase